LEEAMTAKDQIEATQILVAAYKAACNSNHPMSASAMRAIYSALNRVRCAIFTPGTRVTYSGFPGSIVRHYSEGMFEVRLSRGTICVTASDLRLA
jgi:hypothetical protein